MKLSTEELFETWNQALASLFERGPGEEALGDLISAVVPFDVYMVFEYREGEARSVFHNIADLRRKVVIEDYLRGPFLLDPFYTHSITGKANGLLDMRRLSPDQFQKSEFFRHHYYRTSIGDEIGLALPSADEASIVISITRRIGTPRFSARDKALFEAMMPVITLLGKQLWQQAAPEADPPPSKRIEDAFNAFGQDVLSRREIEIVSLVLKGHSSISVGEVLGITPGTVKIHRKNIYAKLGISTQAELFNKFIRYFTGE
ncbi:MAG: helix-turn-helix transcriptional regulator [Nitratireductor sp.]|nr:helix-turn-helix transcriptional regulator [Nitratireductor sp.]